MSGTDKQQGADQIRSLIRVLERSIEDARRKRLRDEEQTDQSAPAGGQSNQPAVRPASPDPEDHAGNRPAASRTATPAPSASSGRAAEGLARPAYLRRPETGDAGQWHVAS